MHPSSLTVAAALLRMSIGVCFTGRCVTPIFCPLVPRLKVIRDLSYWQTLLMHLAFRVTYLLAGAVGLAAALALPASCCSGMARFAWFCLSAPQVFEARA